MPKKRGRPKVSAAEKRAKSIGLRLKPDERKKLEAAAKNRDMTVSEYVRFVVMAAADIESMLPPKKQRKTK